MVLNGRGTSFGHDVEKMERVQHLLDTRIDDHIGWFS